MKIYIKKKIGILLLVIFTIILAIVDINFSIDSKINYFIIFLGFVLLLQQIYFTRKRYYIEFNYDYNNIIISIIKNDKISSKYIIKMNDIEKASLMDSILLIKSNNSSLHLNIKKYLKEDIKTLVDKINEVNTEQFKQNLSQLNS